MPAPHVVLDANIIVHAYIRDLLLDAHIARVCRVRWTDAILAEARRALIADLGRSEAETDRLLAAMRRIRRIHLTGYEGQIAAMTNDPHDRHVAAAAVQARADVVTFNLRHFRARDLAPFGIAAIHPDPFLTALAADAPRVLARIVRAQVAQRTLPPLTADAYLDRLAGSLPRFVGAVRASLTAANAKE